ncbi:MAG: chemotaxis protein CheW [Gammaproteobacteria bacterium]|nr:chemotaxis protein CheW [Gammaproteobacteria bacterium]
MPASQRNLRLLRERAKLLAQKGKASHSDEGELFLEVVLGRDGHYGIPYHWLREVMPAQGLTAVPGSPPWVAGVMPRRGELMTVIALEQILGSSETPTPAPLVVVVTYDGMNLGLLVHQIEGNHRFFLHELTPPVHSQSQNSGIMLGIYSGKIAMLDISGIIASTEMMRGTTGEKSNGEEDE